MGGLSSNLLEMHYKISVLLRGGLLTIQQRDSMNLQYLYTKALYQHIFYSQVLHDSYLSKQLIVSASGYFFASLIHSLLMLCFHENTSTLHPLSRAVTAHLGKLVSHSDLPFIPSPVANTSIPGVSSQRAWILNSFHQENVLEVFSTLLQQVSFTNATWCCMLFYQFKPQQ